MAATVAALTEITRPSSPFAAQAAAPQQSAAVSGRRNTRGEELKVMVDEVQSGGSIDEHEGELIRSAIEFNDLDVEDILTPRVQVVAVEERDTLEEISDKFLQNGYSRGRRLHKIWRTAPHTGAAGYGHTRPAR